MLNSDTQEYIPRNLRQQYPSSHFKEASYSSQSKSVLKRSVNSKRLCPLNNSIIHSFSECKYYEITLTSQSFNSSYPAYKDKK